MLILSAPNNPLKNNKLSTTTPKKYVDHPYQLNMRSTPHGTN